MADFKKAILCSILGFIFYFFVTPRAGLHALMLCICCLIQLTAAALFFQHFCLSEMLRFSSFSASKGLLCSDWPVQTQTFQMNL